MHRFNDLDKVEGFKLAYYILITYNFHSIDHAFTETILVYTS